MSKKPMQLKFFSFLLLLGLTLPLFACNPSSQEGTGEGDKTEEASEEGDEEGDEEGGEEGGKTKEGN